MGASHCHAHTKASPNLPLITYDVVPAPYHLAIASARQNGKVLGGGY